MYNVLVQVRPKLVERIKACPPLLRIIKGLKECNLEFLTVDSRTVTTEHPDALVRYDLHVINPSITVCSL